MKRYYAAKVDEVPEGGKKIVEIEGIEIGLFQVEKKFYAWVNVCPHMLAPVCKGRICGTRLPSMVYEYEYGMENHILRCPWHGWEFDLTTGKHLVDSKVKLKGYPVEVDGDDLFVLMKPRSKKPNQVFNEQ